MGMLFHSLLRVYVLGTGLTLDIIPQFKNSTPRGPSPKYIQAKKQNCFLLAIATNLELSHLAVESESRSLGVPGAAEVSL